MTRGYCILQIDDDPDIVEIVTALLQPVYNVAHTGTLAEARIKMINEKFNLVLLDLVLPDGSGFDLLTSMPDLNAATPVVIFSGLEDNRVILNNVQATLVNPVHQTHNCLIHYII